MAIAFADINHQKAKEVAEQSKSLAINPEYRALAVAVDVTSSLSVQRLVELVIKDFGRIDYSVNAAGVNAS